MDWLGVYFADHAIMRIDFNSNFNCIKFFYKKICKLEGFLKLM